MKRSDIEAIIVGIIVGQLGLEKPRTGQDRFREDFGAELIEVAEIIRIVQEEFDIEISKSDVSGLKTLYELVNYVFMKLLEEGK